MPPELIWRIELFGGLKIRRGEICIDRFRTRQTGALLAFLAFHGGMHRRETLIEMLWPDKTPETGRNNLRLALSSLRRILEPGEDEHGTILLADRVCVGLNAVSTLSDVSEFEASLKTRTPPDDLVPLQRAAELYCGRLLPDFYESWIPMEEQRLEDLFLDALDRLIGVLEERGEYQQALEYARHGARLVPQRPETERFIERLRDFSKRRDIPQTNLVTCAATSSPAPRAALPPAFTRFIGRERELKEVLELLKAHRLITLTATGGGGKTRLGVETLRCLNGKNIFFVALSEVLDAHLLNSTLIEALDLSPPLGSDLEAEVLRALAANPAILMLDNFEQLLPEGANWVQRLLDGAPELRLLITSRTRLKLEGEREYSVSPLPFAALSSDWKERSLEELKNTASAQLFADRARAVRPGFHITAHNAATISTILQKLGGVPLAIELVAARAAVLAPAQMLTRLQRILDFPPDDNDTRPMRHRSLRAAIQCSLQLLGFPLRRFFSSLSTFRGDFNEAAAQVVSGEAQTLNFLSQLQDSSLLQSEENACGEMRFRLLEMPREAALEDASEADLLQWRHRHAEFFLKKVEIDTEFGAQFLELEACIIADLDNIRAALDWARDNRESEIGLRIVSALWWFWSRNGHLQEGRQRLARLMKLAPDEVAPLVWSRALRSAGWLALQQGDYEAAQTHLENALEAARQRNDEDAVAGVLNVLGGVQHWQGKWERAYELYAESLQLRRTQENRHDFSVALNSLAGVACALGKTQETSALCREALVIWRELDDVGGLAWTFNLQGLVALAEDDFTTARARFEKSLQLRRATKTRSGEAKSLHDLAELNRREGKTAVALDLHQQSLQIRRDLHHNPDIAASLLSLGILARETGNQDQSREYLHEGLLLFLEMNDARDATRCRDVLDCE